MPSPAFTKLRAKLADLFQLDAAAELDFGIYRILNARRGEIARFLDSLEDQVEAILGQAGADAGAPLRAELAKTIGDLEALGVEQGNIGTNKNVKALRDKLAALGTAGQEAAALRDDIFSLLTTFFSRYYKDGDFLSLRRYKADTYAIPYEGEEVKLHWANADQFYIKSAENFRDYTFRLGPPPTGDAPDRRPRVTFKLTEADTEKDNNKPAAGKERRFIFHSVLAPEPAADGVPHLTLGFTYQPAAKDQKQADLNADASARILKECAKGPFLELAAKRPTEKKKDRTLLDKHLSDYTARNTFDYFVHKDLGGFLRRELDFFIKNEVVHLDDLDDAPEPTWTALRARLKALRAIAHKVIRFLAQIEDFQKKLWLKKKFVTACDYVVTLDRLPEDLYPAIAACHAQREEWVRLMAIDEIEADLGRPGYSEPLTVEFLKANRFLPVDTRWLGDEARFTIQGLLSSFKTCLVINSENFQALRNLNKQFKEGIDAFYVDPPYNTGSDGFQYRDNYRHSSWMSMINDRLIAAHQLMSEDCVGLISIDDREAERLNQIIQGSGRFDHYGTLIWNTEGHTDNQLEIKVNHEYITILSRADGVPVFGNVVDPNTRTESNLWKGFAENSITKNGPGNPPSEVILPIDFPCEAQSLDLPSSGLELAFFQSISEKGHISRDITQRFDAEYPIRLDRMVIESGRLTAECRVYSGWANVNKLKVFIQAGCTPLPEADGGTLRFYLSPKGVIYYRRERTAARNIVSVLRNLSTTEKMRSELENMGLVFAYPKPKELITYLIKVAGHSDRPILDFFAGSGTTGHAVINLNREDGGNRRYILVEMGEHFDTVLVPRLKKVIYAKDWKDGKPVSRDSGVSHCFKVLRLESYEDTLNNLRLHRSPEQQSTLDELDLSHPEAAEDYRLGYMLDLESAGSASLLSTAAFTDPWSYTLDVASGTAGETRPVHVDLVETFNWLLGLTVTSQARSGGVLWVEGTNPQGEKVLILWRKLTGPDAVDSPALNAWCQKLKVSVLDGEYALIYVNGDHHLDNLRRPDQTWKVRLIDEEFPRLMFAD